MRTYQSKVVRQKYVAWLDVPMQHPFLLEIDQGVDEHPRDAS